MRDTLSAHVARVADPGGSYTNSYLLPDFTIVVVNPGRFTVAELDRTGKTVWEHKAGVPVFRARRR